MGQLTRVGQKKLETGMVHKCQHGAATCDAAVCVTAASASHCCPPVRHCRLCKSLLPPCASQPPLQVTAASLCVTAASASPCCPPMRHCRLCKSLLPPCASLPPLQVTAALCGTAALYVASLLRARMLLISFHELIKLITFNLV